MSTYLHLHRRWELRRHSFDVARDTFNMQTVTRYVAKCSPDCLRTAGLNRDTFSFLFQKQELAAYSTRGSHYLKNQVSVCGLCCWTQECNLVGQLWKGWQSWPTFQKPIRWMTYLEFKQVFAESWQVLHPCASNYCSWSPEIITEHFLTWNEPPVPPSLTLLAPNCTLAFPLTKVALICMMTDSME